MTTVGNGSDQSRSQLGLSLSQLAHRIGAKGQTLEDWKKKDRRGPCRVAIEDGESAASPMTWPLIRDMNRL